MEMPRVPLATSSASATPTAPTRPEFAPVAVPPVDAMPRLRAGMDSVQIALFAGRGIAALVRDARRALADSHPERRREGLALLRAIAGHPAAMQALPELRALWERGTAAERAEAETCLRAITGRGAEQWSRGEPFDDDPPGSAGTPAQRGHPRGSDEPSPRPAALAAEPPVHAVQHWLIQLMMGAAPALPTLMGGSLLAAAALVYLAFR